ncbi:MAG: hypothetical protein ABI851_03310 [Saprospiraceae bacterium]
MSSLMGRFILPCLILISNNLAAIPDSGIVFKAIYTNKEWKKESKDIKQFSSVIKEFVKANKSTNVDLKNSALESLKLQMKKEYDELNNRITSRAKKFSPSKKSKDTLIVNDMPKGYNPTIKGQIEHVDKSALLEGRSETEILLLYSRILNKENRIIRQLAMMEEITDVTPPSSFEAIIKNAADFKSAIEEEVKLMAKEKGKKNPK